MTELNYYRNEVGHNELLSFKYPEKKPGDRFIYIDPEWWGFMRFGSSKEECANLLHLGKSYFARPELRFDDGRSGEGELYYFDKDPGKLIKVVKRENYKTALVGEHGVQNFSERFGHNKMVALFLENIKHLLPKPVAEYHFSAPREYMATPMYVVMDRINVPNLPDNDRALQLLLRSIDYKLLHLGKLLQFHNISPFSKTMMSELKLENLMVDVDKKEIYVIDQGTPVRGTDYSMVRNVYNDAYREWNSVLNRVGIKLGTRKKLQW